MRSSLSKSSRLLFIFQKCAYLSWNNVHLRALRENCQTLFTKQKEIFTFLIHWVTKGNCQIKILLGIFKLMKHNFCLIKQNFWFKNRNFQNFLLINDSSWNTQPIDLLQTLALLSFHLQNWSNQILLIKIFETWRLFSLKQQDLLIWRRLEKISKIRTSFDWWIEFEHFVAPSTQIKLFVSWKLLILFNTKISCRTFLSLASFMKILRSKIYFK